jgi:hypothetical protein
MVIFPVLRIPPTPLGKGGKCSTPLVKGGEGGIEMVRVNYGTA